MSAGPVNIRSAKPVDCDAINAIYNFYVRTSPATFDLEEMTPEWRHAWFESHQRNDLPVLVAESPQGEIAGWCCISTWSPKAAYARTVDESIYIADAWRGRGVGRTLVSAILDEARTRELHVVMAGIVACQEPSLALHRALGFEISGTNRHMGYKLGAWHDVVYLQRHLWG